MTNSNTIIDDMFPLEDKTEYINALARYELLILDDLGTERNLSLIHIYDYYESVPRFRAVRIILGIISLAGFGFFTYKG